MASQWHDVGSSDDISDDMPLTAKVGDREIGVFLYQSKYYAMEDVCPHAYALLSQGFMMGEEVECPLHGARFSITTGKCTQEPGGRDLRTYPVKVEGGRVFVEVPA